jgi:hypothetical protein
MNADRRHTGTDAPNAATGSHRASAARTRLPRQLLPQARPAPTLPEATAVIAFLQARLGDGCPAGRLAARLLAADGLLSRYRDAVIYAAHPPHGLEHAWELTSATLAREVTDLAAAWSDHPDFDPKWIR